MNIINTIRLFNKYMLRGEGDCGRL